MKLKTFYRKLVYQDYNIGFTFTPLENVLKGDKIEYRWLKHSYKDRCFADPFILDVDENEIKLFAEVIPDDTHRGYLALLIVDKSTFVLKDLKTILKLDTHLSFPIIIREGGKIYVHPENGASGNHNLYSFDSHTCRLTFEKTIIHEPLKDAVTIQIDGTEYLFSTQPPYSNENKLDIREFVDGEYVANTNIVFRDNIARMAGDFIYYNNQLYRPAQDCREVYGGAILIQKVIKNGNNWNFETIRRIVSEHPTHRTGMHTWNTYKNLTVVDIRGYRHTILGPRMAQITNIIKRILK